MTGGKEITFADIQLASNEIISYAPMQTKQYEVTKEGN